MTPPCNVQAVTQAVKSRCSSGDLAVWLVCVMAMTAVGPALAADNERAVAQGRVVRLTLPIDNRPTTGVIARYDTITFTLRTQAGETHRVLWNAIPATNVDRYWRYLEQPEADAEALFELGDMLIRHRDGKALAERAFKQALDLDPLLAQAIERSRKGVQPDGSPRFVGTADPQMWGPLSDQAMQKGVASLRAFCEKAQRTLNIELSLYNSQRFLLLTDLPAKSIEPLSNKLTRAYRELAQRLGDDPDGNIFRGKCLIVLFDKRVDYIRFQRDLHDTDARGTGGLCHGFGDGHVHIAAYKRGNARQTRHILIHEFAHAYLHRYRSPVPIDDWLNEGLAEHLAHQLEPPPGKTSLYLKARLELEGKKGLGEGFFQGENLASWQYDVAGALTNFLFERSKPAYPKLIRSIKDGTPTLEALQTIYRMEPRVLTQRFKRRLDRELERKLGG